MCLIIFSVIIKLFSEYLCRNITFSYHSMRYGSVGFNFYIPYRGKYGRKLWSHGLVECLCKSRYFGHSSYYMGALYCYVHYEIFCGLLIGPSMTRLQHSHLRYAPYMSLNSIRYLPTGLKNCNISKTFWASPQNRFI